MTNIERQKLFVRFLKENNIYKLFLKYLKESNLNEHMLNGNRTIDSLVNTIVEYDFKSFNEIILAFKWKETKENWEFWAAFNNKWLKVLKYGNK